MDIYRKCVCGKKFRTRSYRILKFCSKKCRYENAHRPSGLKYKLVKVNPTSFKKGQKPWNDGLAGKGVCKANNGSIKKGQRISIATEFKKGQKSWNADKKIWKGERKEYTKIHRWVRKQKGKPKKCARCGSIEKVVWGNISQEYKYDVSDWMEICKSCHTKNDFQFIKEKYGT